MNITVGLNRKHHTEANDREITDYIRFQEAESKHEEVIRQQEVTYNDESMKIVTKKQVGKSTINNVMTSLNSVRQWERKLHSPGGTHYFSTQGSMSAVY